jgi:hypothetical protein
MSIDIDTDMITTNNKSKSKTKSKCPICHHSLSIKDIDDKYDIQYCSSCRREFYPVKEDYDEQSKLEYDDIETILDNDSNEGPILLCEKTKEKEQDYLRRHFASHCKITTEIYIPE